MKKTVNFLLVMGIVFGLAITLIPDFMHDLKGIYCPMWQNMVAAMVGFVIMFACMVALMARKGNFKRFEFDDMA